MRVVGVRDDDTAQSVLIVEVSKGASGDAA